MILDYGKALQAYQEQEIGTTSMGLGERPALLVVDFTEGFTNPASPMGVDMSPAVESTVALLDVVRAREIPVAFTTNSYRSDMGDAGVWPKKFPSLRHLAAGTPWVELDRRLIPDEHDLVVNKNYPSAFFGTSILSWLVAHQVDSVIITGCTTSGCIRATTVDALQYGFRPFVVEDCVADRDEAPHRANLFDLASKYADVASRETLVDLL